jgi:hypothetical protein
MASELFNLINQNRYHDKNDKHILDFMKQKAKTSHYQYTDSEGVNAFYLAVVSKKHKIVRHMLSLYKNYQLLFNANVQDSEGNTPFILAFKKRDDICSLNLMDFYIKNPQLINPNIVNQRGENFLHFLFHSMIDENKGGNIWGEIVRAKLLHHFDFSQVNYLEQSPSVLFLNEIEKRIENNIWGIYDNLSIILQSKNHNLDLNCVNKKGENLLLIACSHTTRPNESVKLIDLIMEHREKINLMLINHKGQNALAKINHQDNSLIADKLLSYSEFNQPQYIKQALEKIDTTSHIHGVMKVYIEKNNLENNFSLENEKLESQRKKLKI